MELKQDFSSGHSQEYSKKHGARAVAAARTGDGWLALGEAVTVFSAPDRNSRPGLG